VQRSSGNREISAEREPALPEVSRRPLPRFPAVTDHWGVDPPESIHRSRFDRASTKPLKSLGSPCPQLLSCLSLVPWCLGGQQNPPTSLGPPRNRPHATGVVNRDSASLPSLTEPLTSTPVDIGQVSQGRGDANSSDRLRPTLPRPTWRNASPRTDFVRPEPASVVFSFQTDTSPPIHHPPLLRTNLNPPPN
jgi:hypothetical protein